MGTLIVILVIIIILVVLASVIGVSTLRSSRQKSTTAGSAPTPRTNPPAEPMSGLETALDQVIGRAGTPIRDRIDAESSHVDDHTGPLLRRALDQVAPASASPDSVAADDTSAEPA